MKTQANILSLVLSLPVLGLPIAAQQVVTFSFDGTKGLSGKDNLGGPSDTSVRIGGQTVPINSPAGTSPAGCATALKKALTARGFKLGLHPGDNQVKVIEGPGGADLTTGGIISNTDTGLQGVDVRVMNPVLNCFKVKGNGVNLPMMVAGRVAMAGGLITIELEIEKLINGKKTPVPVKIGVNVIKGDSSSVIDQKVLNALRKSGFIAHETRMPSVFNQKRLIPSITVDRTLMGEPVQHVAYMPSIPRELVQMEVGAGRTDLVGATNYGTPTVHGLTHAPFINWEGTTNLGGQLQISLEQAPPQNPAVFLVGVRDADIPFLYPGGRLLVDPSLGLVINLFTNPAGRAGMHFTVPPQTALSGLRLYWQGMAFIFKGTGMSLSDGLVTVIGH